MAGSILAQEFSSGTIKILSITPYKRWKILYGKYAAVILTAVGYMLLQYLLLIPIGLLLFGITDISVPYLSIGSSGVVESNYLLHILGIYFLNSISLILIVTFAFMISSLMRSNTLAIAASLFMYFVGSA